MTTRLLHEEKTYLLRGHMVFFNRISRNWSKCSKPYVKCNES